MKNRKYEYTDSIGEISPLLSVRVQTVLAKYKDIKTIGDFMSMLPAGFTRLRGVGRKALEELLEAQETIRAERKSGFIRVNELGEKEFDYTEMALEALNELLARTTYDEYSEKSHILATIEILKRRKGGDV